jgi:hypothetical protein
VFLEKHSQGTLGVNMEFGILSRPRALPLPRYLRHISYVLLSNVFAIFSNGFPLFF